MIKQITPCPHCGEHYEGTRYWIGTLCAWFCLACRQTFREVK